MSDPSLMTKAKLKEELIRHNIPLPKSDARKQSYIDLYTEHVLGDYSDDENTTEVDENGDQSGESDSEVVFKKSTSKNSSSVSKGSGDFVSYSKDQETSTMTSVKDLTDAELAKELRSRGAAPGPITATTRNVYEKKLLKLRQAEGIPTETYIETSIYEEVPDDEERSPPPKPRTPVKRTTRARKVEPEPDYMGEESTITHRVPTQIAAKSAPQPETVVTRKQATTQKTSSKIQHNALPRWVKFLVFVGVFFFAYLVYINMETSGSRVPKISKGPAS